MASWSDNLEAVARAVCAKTLAHDGISEGAACGRRGNVVAHGGGGTRERDHQRGRRVRGRRDQLGAEDGPSTAIGCAGTPRAARSGRAPGTGHRCRVRKVPCRRTSLTCLKLRDMEGEVLAGPTGSPARSGSGSRNCQADITLSLTEIAFVRLRSGPSGRYSPATRLGQPHELPALASLQHLPNPCLDQALKCCRRRCRTGAADARRTGGARPGTTREMSRSAGLERRRITGSAQAALIWARTLVSSSGDAVTFSLDAQGPGRRNVGNPASWSAAAAMDSAVL